VVEEKMMRMGREISEEKKKKKKKKKKKDRYELMKRSEEEEEEDIGLRIGQNVNILWNNPIQVCIAYFNRRRSVLLTIDVLNHIVSHIQLEESSKY